MDYIQLGSRIRTARLELKITQAQLAEIIDVSTPFVGQIERGERKFSIETFVHIASCLNVSLDYLTRDSMCDNMPSTLSELSFLLDNRSNDDIKLAVDVLQSVFQHIDKYK